MPVHFEIEDGLRHSTGSSAILAMVPGIKVVTDVAVEVEDLSATGFSRSTLRLGVTRQSSGLMPRSRAIESEARATFKSYRNEILG